MGFSDIFKGKQYKSELEALQQKYDELQALLTPEMRNALTLQEKNTRTGAKHSIRAKRNRIS